MNIVLLIRIEEAEVKTKRPTKPVDHALLIEWGGLTAGAYGRPAVLALLLIVFGLIALKFI